jgi:HK97 family phage major capsid protein
MDTMFKSKPAGFSVDGSFKESFQGAVVPVDDEYGGVSKEYWNPWTKNNQLPMIRNHFAELAKASSIDSQTGGAGTAGTALVPVYVDSTPVDRTVRETPMRSLIPRRAVKGLTYDYISLTAKGGAVWAFENAAVADQVDTYDRISVYIKFLYAKGRISGPAIAGMRGFIDPNQLDLSVKTASMIEAEEDAIINGDASTNPEEPDGLITAITTNTTNFSGGLPTLAQIRAEFATSFNANGMITLAVTDATTHNYVKGLLIDFQRQVTNPSQATLGFGIPDAFELDGVMFIKDRFMPTGASSKRILFLDMRYIFMAVLQDLTYEEKASENDSRVYMLKEYIAPIITFQAACTQMYGIA